MKSSGVVLAFLFALAACGENKEAGDESGGASDTVRPSLPVDDDGRATGPNLATRLQASSADLPKAERKFVVTDDIAQTTFENVALSDKAIVVPSAAMGKQGKTNGTQEFETAKLGPLAGKLKRDVVLLVPGRLLGKIESVKTSGSKTIVKTKFAALTDVFQDAKIGWNAALPISKGHITAFVMPDGRTLPVQNRVKYAGLGSSVHALPMGPMEWSLQDGPLTYKVKLDPKGSHVDFKAQVTRKMANTGGMTYTAKIKFKPVDVQGAGEIKAGKTKSFDIKQKELGGEIELSVAAAGAGRSELKKELPMPVFKWIVLVGPIPLVITAKARIIGRVDLPVKGSSIATAKYSFGGEAGFKYNGSSIEAKAAFPKEEFKIDKPFDAAGFIGGAVDAQFGVAFPVVGMAMFDSFFMPEIIPGSQLGVRLTWGPVCKTGYVLFTLKAAYDFKVLGVSLSQGKKALFEKRKDSKGKKCRK